MPIDSTLVQSLVEPTTRLYELNDINQSIVNLIFVDVSLVISILLVFWWQAAQSRFDYINTLIANFLDATASSLLKNLNQRYLQKQYEILVAKKKFNADFNGKFGLIFIASVFLLFVALMLSLGALLIVCLEVFGVYEICGFNFLSVFPIAYTPTHLIYTGILFVIALFSLFVIYQIRGLVKHKSSSTGDLVDYYIELFETRTDLGISKPTQTTQNMENKISRKRSMFLGAIAVIAFILAFGLGVAVNTLTGIPLTGGIVNGIIVGAVITIGVKGANRFWSATVIWTVFAFLAMPTTTFGFPGWYKPIVGLLSGLVWDFLTFVVFKKQKDFLKYIVPAGLGAVVITIGVFLCMGWFGIPGYDKLKAFLKYMLPLYFVISALGSWLGLLLYKKYLSNNAYIQGLQ